MEDTNLLRCFVLSGSQFFSRDLIQQIQKYRFGIDIVKADNFSELLGVLTERDIIFIDEVFAHHADKAGFEEFISFLCSSKIHGLFFTNYKKKLPNILQGRPDLIRIVSKSAGQDEFHFHMESVEMQIKAALSGVKNLKDKYHETTIQIQNLLIENSSTKFDFENILELIGKATKASSVILFENRSDYQGNRLLSLKYQWSAQGILSESLTSLFSLLPFQPNFARWEDILSNGDNICAKVEDLPQAEQAILKNLNIGNLLLMPILITNEFWGFVMLTNTDRALWTDSEVSLISSALVPITCFFKAQNAVRQENNSIERLFKIFNSSTIGSVVGTLEGKVISCNSAFSEMIGYDERELRNLNFRVFTHPEDLEKENRLLKNLLDGKISSFLIEMRLLSKNGEIVWVKLNLSIFAEDKETNGLLIGIVENITREKEAEKALEESEDRYKKLSDLSFEGIVIHKDGVVIDCNERFLAMSGYSREDVVGRDNEKFLADQKSIDLMSARLQQDDFSPYEAIGLTKTGILIPVELENRNIEYQGQVFNVTAVRDITKRKQNEQEIRKLNTAIEQSPSSIVITDKKGKIEYVNKSFYEITGYTRDEALGKNPRILKTEYHDKAFYKHLWHTISSGKTWSGIFKNKTKSGSHYWERALISPIFDDSGEITHYLAIKENITQEKIAQEALKLSEERHRIISELTNDFVYSAILSSNTLHLEWKSGVLEKLSEYSMEEINGMEKGWYSVALKEDYNSIIVPRITRIKEKDLSLVYRIQTKSGNTKWVIDRIKFLKNNGDSDECSVIGAIQDITLWKETNLALDQSKRYLDSIIDNLPIGLQIFDKDGYSVRTNITHQKLFGIKDINAVNGTFNILKDPAIVARGYNKIYHTVYDTKKPVNHELEIDFDLLQNQWLTRKGKRVINEIIFPIISPTGEIHSVISLSEDITKRVSAEKALKASELHQKTLLKLIPDLIFVITEDGIFKDVYTDDSGSLLLPPNQFLGKHFYEIFSEDLSEKFYASLNKAVETKELQFYNYEIEEQGKLFYYEARLLVSKENEVLAIVRDITDNTIAEIALKQNEEKFRELTERIQDALVLFSVSNEILYVSPNLENILGIDTKSYTKRPLEAMKLIHPEDKHWVIPELNDYRKGRLESLDMQFRVVLKDQTQKWIWYRENTIFDENHDPVRYATVITDISASKKIEEELKLAKEEAEKANRSKSAFLANISHEIRTPMNAVLGFSDLLYSRIQDPVLKGYLNSIKSSGKTLLNLLNDILDLSKIEAEKMSIIPAPVNIFTVFDEIKHIFSLKALEKGLNYSFEIDTHIPQSLMLDELRLKQIFLNLVDNALKFTDKGGIRVMVSKLDSEHSSDKTDIKIIVEDTGIGIPVYMQQSIFDSFRQHDEQDKKKFKGTGLGLAITKQLVELHNGQIHLESEVNKGSKFEVRLKGIDICSPSKDMDSIHERDIRLRIPEFKDKVIVLIDQQPSNRDLINEVFRFSESVVIEGENLEQTISALNYKADVLLLELGNLRSVNQNLDLINNNNNLKNALKIGISPVTEVDQSYANEFDAILIQPIHLPELIDIISRHFNSIDLRINEGSKQHPELIKKEALKEVISLLEGENYKLWQATQHTSSFSEIEDFAQIMKEIGLKYQLGTLMAFSDVLVMHAKNFDIDNINDVLSSYPSIINELKNSL